VADKEATIRRKNQNRQITLCNAVPFSVKKITMPKGIARRAKKACA
jgi:hypothetical protein